MKLLRLLSVNETESDFTAQFQEPIDIPANSKIALQQVSFNLEPEFISVSTDNNKFYLNSNRYPTSAQPYSLVNIVPGNYNIQDFTTALTEGLNSGLLDPTFDNTFETTETTMDMTAYVDENKLMNIEYAIESVVRDQGDAMKLEGIVNDDSTPPNYTKSGTYPSDWGVIYSVKPFSTGQGYIETTINAEGEDYDGVCIGVFDLTADLLVDNPNISPDLYTFSLTTIGGTYWTKPLDNVAEDSGITVLNKDKIFMSQGRRPVNGDFETGITFWVKHYNEGDETYGDAVFIKHFTYDFNQVLHAGLSLTADGRVQGFAFSVSAFANTTEQGVSRVNTIAEIDKHTYLRFSNGGLGASSTDIFYLTFNPASKALLGFPSLTTQRITGLVGTWKGNISMYNLAIPSALVVEMPNLPLLSYDSYLHRRRPIIAVIPSKDLEVNNDTITYTTNYPVFIDINNKYQELLNSIRVRLVATNNKPLKIKPIYGCDISVLLD